MLPSLLCLALLMPASRGLEVSVRSEEVIVEEGDSLELLCQSQDQWNVCEWTREQDRSVNSECVCVYINMCKCECSVIVCIPKS